MLPDPYWLIVWDAIGQLANPAAWFDSGGDTPQQAAAVIQAALDSWVVSRCVMIGQIIDNVWGSPPAGLLPCDGSVYDAVDYPELWDVIHAAYKISGTQFRTPDLRGRVPVFAGTGAGLSVRDVGDSGGVESVELTAAQNGPHTHSYQLTTIGDIDLESVGAPQPTLGLNVAAQTGSSGTGQPHDNMPPYNVLPLPLIVAGSQYA